jgi:ABC-2 type transport system ATP-binding protein
MELTMKWSLETTFLSKTYGKTEALNGLNLKIASGTIYGLIGPNGAGKTTVLAILGGLVKPTAGSAWMLGMKVRPGCRELAAKAGFSSPQFPLLDYLSGYEILATCGRMHQLAPEEVRARIIDLLALLDLRSAENEYVCHYSYGMRQKLSLACALIHSPEVILLDEPFLGLDPVSVYRLTFMLKQMAANGRTILISSHDMTLMERLCHTAGILHKGVLQREITLKSPAADTPTIHKDICAQSFLEAALWEVAGIPEIKTLSWI